MNEILISGYYGFKNSGDDALLQAITNDLKKYKKDIRIVVLSRNPKETTAVYGVRAINRMNLFSVLFALLHCRMVISGGGTLIQDGTSTKSLLYYLAIISTAKLFGKKVMLYSNGIGPLKDENIPRTKRVLDKVDVITLRDKMSYDALCAIGVSKPEIKLTADPAFALDAADSTAAREILNKAGVPRDRKIMGICVRPWRALPPGFEDAVAAAADYAAEKYGFYPVFLPMQKQNDTEIANKIIGRMKNEACLLQADMDIPVLLAVFGEMSLCVGMRLHSLIYAAAREVPVVGLVYDPKVTGVMDYMNQRQYLDAELLAPGQLERTIDDCMENYDQYRREIRKNVEILRKKAEENAKYAVELFDKEC